MIREDGLLELRLVQTVRVEDGRLTMIPCWLSRQEHDQFRQEIADPGWTTGERRYPIQDPLLYTRICMSERAHRSTDAPHLDKARTVLAEAYRARNAGDLRGETALAATAMQHIGDHDRSRLAARGGSAPKKCLGILNALVSILAEEDRSRRSAVDIWHEVPEETYALEVDGWDVYREVEHSNAADRHLREYLVQQPHDGGRPRSIAYSSYRRRYLSEARSIVARETPLGHLPR